MRLGEEGGSRHHRLARKMKRKGDPCPEASPTGTLGGHRNKPSRMAGTEPMEPQCWSSDLWCLCGRLYLHGLPEEARGHLRNKGGRSWSTRCEMQDTPPRGCARGSRSRRWAQHSAPGWASGHLLFRQELRGPERPRPQQRRSPNPRPPNSPSQPWAWLAIAVVWEPLSLLRGHLRFKGRAV